MPAGKSKDADSEQTLCRWPPVRHNMQLNVWVMMATSAARMDKCCQVHGSSDDSRSQQTQQQKVQ